MTWKNAQWTCFWQQLGIKYKKTLLESKTFVKHCSFLHRGTPAEILPVCFWITTCTKLKAARKFILLFLFFDYSMSQYRIIILFHFRFSADSTHKKQILSVVSYCSSHVNWMINWWQDKSKRLNVPLQFFIVPFDIHGKRDTNLFHVTLAHAHSFITSKRKKNQILSSIQFNRVKTHKRILKSQHKTKES